MADANEIKEKLDAQLELIKQGMPAEKAHEIVSTRIVDTKHDTVFAFAIALIVILIVILLCVMLKHGEDELERICDKWVDASGKTYIITGIDRERKLAKGISPTRQQFLVWYNDVTQKYHSTLPIGAGQLRKDQMIWGDRVWNREIIFY
jgi:hypothetical protein